MEKLWRLTALGKNDTLALFTTYEHAKIFATRIGLEEFELHPCYAKLSAIEESFLDEKFRECVGDDDLDASVNDAGDCERKSGSDSRYSDKK